MAHFHHCEVCGIVVANCTDERCKEDAAHPNAGEQYCSLHHPDPAHKIEMAPPPPRYAVLVKDQRSE